MRVRKTISKTIKNKIKKEYEAGISLKDIADRYNLNYDSLRHYVRKDNWEKGKTIALYSNMDNYDRVYKLREDFIEKENKYRSLMNDLLEAYEELSNRRDIKINPLTNTPSGKERIFVKSQWQSIQARMDTLERMYEFERKLYFAYTEEEQLQINKLKAEYEELKTRIELDKTAIEIKAKEIDTELKETKIIGETPVEKESSSDGFDEAMENAVKAVYGDDNS